MRLRVADVLIRYESRLLLGSIAGSRGARRSNSDMQSSGSVCGVTSYVFSGIVAFDNVRVWCCEGLDCATSCSSDDHSGWWLAFVMNGRVVEHTASLRQ